MTQCNSHNLHLQSSFKQPKEGFETHSTLKSLLQTFEASNTSNNTQFKTHKTTALQLYLKEIQWKIPRTFIPSLDSLLAEQIRPGLITEITGSSGTGKTQLCFHLSLGVEGGTFIITTNQNFAPHRLRALATQYIGNANQALERIYVLEASNCDEIYRKLQALDQFFAANQISLIIIDSIAWPLRQQVAVKRTTSFCALAQLLRSIANLNSCSVLLINDVSIKKNSYKSSSFGDSFYHIVNNKILFYIDNHSSNRAKLLKSVICTSSEDATFEIQ